MDAKAPPSLPKYLTKDEYARIRLSAEDFSIRDRAIILFLFSSGCRSKEICGLSIEDINFENQTAKIKDKRGMDRHILFSEKCGLVLKEYIQTRGAKPEEPLFASPTGQRLKPAAIIRLTRILGEKARLYQTLTPSVCRNTFAKALLDRGIGFVETAVLLGYRNDNTALKYLRIVDNDRRNAPLSY